MDEIESEVVVADADAEGEEVTPEAELTETTDWKAEAKKARGIAKRLQTKLTKATEKKVVVEAPKNPDKKEEASKTGELDETQLDYLDLKGISDDEDVKIIQQHVQRTGETIRQALKDDYVQSKLKGNKEAREVQNAMPGSSKRANAGGAPSLAVAIAKFEQTGELPTDFKLRSEVVNAIADKSNSNKPSWH